MSGHTKGPWHVCGCGKCGQVSCSDYPICRVERGDWGDSAEMVYGHIPIAEGDANARLIAAAPDLLEAAQIGAGALEALIAIASDVPEIGATCPGIYSALSKIRAAIAKAEGR